MNPQLIYTMLGVGATYLLTKQPANGTSALDAISKKLAELQKQLAKQSQPKMPSGGGGGSGSGGGSGVSFGGGSFNLGNFLKQYDNPTANESQRASLDNMGALDATANDWVGGLQALPDGSNLFASSGGYDGSATAAANESGSTPAPVDQTYVDPNGDNYGDPGGGDWSGDSGGY